MRRALKGMAATREPYSKGWDTSAIIFSTFAWRSETRFFVQTRRNLIVGPRYVEAWQIRSNPPRGPKAPIAGPSAEKMRVDRAAFEEGKKFDAVVAAFLPPRPIPFHVKKWWQFWK